MNDAFIILDEAQNTTTEQMKMFLTRIGFNPRRWSPATSPRWTCPAAPSPVCATPWRCCRGVDGLSFNFFESKDVVRHPVVARIVQAYEAFDAQQAAERPAASNKENISRENAQ